MSLQTFVDNFIIAQDSGSPIPVTSFQAVPFPTSNHYSSSKWQVLTSNNGDKLFFVGFADTVAGILGLLYTLVFMWPASRIVKQIVEEKEFRIRESMRIMGLSDSVLWVSWFVLYLILFLISAIIIVLITSQNIYKHSDKGYFAMHCIANTQVGLTCVHC